MVPLDVSAFAYWPIIKSGVEIFIADKYVQYFISNAGCDYGLAFLSEHELGRITQID